MLRLTDFVIESNKIEGIRGASVDELRAHETLLKVSPVKVGDLIDFVKVIQPNATFRELETVPGVRVGSHIAPPSGPGIARELQIILDTVYEAKSSPWKTHVHYERLHPFTDGNGRSGRALWLCHMKHQNRLLGALDLGFLHTFYYQTLAAQE